MSVNLIGSHNKKRFFCYCLQIILFNAYNFSRFDVSILKRKIVDNKILQPDENFLWFRIEIKIKKNVGSSQYEFKGNCD